MSLCIPIVLQSVMGLLLNMTDTIMLGNFEKSSEAVISASNIAGQPYFIYSLFLFGVVSGASVLISQYWGKADTDSIASITGMVLCGVVTVCIAVMALYYLFARQLLGLYSQSAEVIALACGYFRIVLLSYLPVTVTTVLYGCLRAVEQVKISMFTNGIAILLNIVLNYLLIFGKFGFPRMGIEGAALATLISRIAEFALILLYMIFRERTVSFTPGKLLKFNKTLLFKLIRYSAPVILSQTLWGLGSTLHSVIVGNLGNEEYAAFTVANLIQQITLLASFGVANAATIIIGKEIGSGRTERVYPYAKTLLALALALGAAMSVGVFALRETIVGFFSIGEVTRQYTLQIIAVFSVLIIFKGFNATAVVGIIRAGGDTVSSMLIDTLSMWLVSLPLGYISAYVLKMPVYIVFACLMSDEIVKFAVSAIRIHSRKWIRNITAR